MPWLAAALAGVLAVGVGACGESAIGPEPAGIAGGDGRGLFTVAPTSAGLITNLQVGTGRPYAVVPDGMGVGARVYIDRAFTYRTLPAHLQGETYIQTADADRNVNGNGRFITFRVSEEATVHVAYNGTRVANWLPNSGFTDSGQTLEVDASGSLQTYQIWSRTYTPAEEVRLGSNRSNPTPLHMYTVIVRPTARDRAPPMPDFNAVINGIRPRGFGQGAYTPLQPAAGRTPYWVATNGSDANPGTSAQPFRTINQAAQVAQAGDVVTIRNGTYDESVFVRHGGTADNRLVFQAENRGGVVLGGSNDKVFQPRGWVGFQGSTGPAWVTLRGLVFRDYGEQMQAASNAVRTGRGWWIEDCLFDRSANTGLNIVDHDTEVLRTTFLSHGVHGFTAGTLDQGATSPSDPLYRPLTGLRVIDVVMRGNHTAENTTDGTGATRVVKLSVTRGALIDNMESYENHGQGMWFDSQNSDFTVRNSYFHSNQGYTPTGGTYRSSAARGLYLEKNWGGGLVENNVMMDNEGPGIQLVNTGDLIIRNNLIVRNDRSILLTNMTDSHPSYDHFPFRNVRIEHNYFKDWARTSSIHYPGGPAETPASMNIVADHNTYHPVRETQLAWWTAPVGGASSIAEMQEKFGWEHNGRIASIPW